MSLQTIDIRRQRSDPLSMMGKSLDKVAIQWRGQPLLDQLIEPVERPDAVGLFSPQRDNLIAPLAIGCIACLQKGLEQFRQPLRRQDPLLQRAHHDAVQLLHSDGAAGTGGVAARRSARAGIVSVATGFAGPDGQCTLTVCTTAFGETDEQCRTGDDARCKSFRIMRGQLCLDRLKRLLVDDWRHLDRNPFLTRSALAGAGVGTIEIMSAHIGGALEHGVDVGDVEWLAAILVVSLVKP
nr:hypothetical protein [uncultured Sphingomonas sp.]